MKIMLKPLFKLIWIVFFSLIYTLIKIKALIHLGVYFFGGIIWQFKPFEPPFKFSFSIMYESDSNGLFCNRWQESDAKGYFLIWKQF